MAETTQEETLMDKKTATAESVDTDKIVQDATVVALANEKTRQDEIRATFKLHGDTYRDLMDSCLAKQEINADHSRKLLLDEIGKGQEPLGSIQLVTDSRDSYRAGCHRYQLAPSSCPLSYHPQRQHRMYHPP